jgi:hypothetical protein
MIESYFEADINNCSAGRGMQSRKYLEIETK